VIVIHTITGEQKLLALIAHLSYLFGGIGLIIAPLVIMILKKDTDYFVYFHAKQALVAHLTAVVISAAVAVLTMLVIGILLLPFVAAIWLILLVTSVIATVKALNGDLYRYPFIQGLVERL
jgi:uncharacterized Tic20 family protein